MKDAWAHECAIYLTDQVAKFCLALIIWANFHQIYIPIKCQETRCTLVTVSTFILKYLSGIYINKSAQAYSAHLENLVKNCFK